MLDESLSHCTNHEIGDLMLIVQERFCIFQPEFAICYHARGRLLRSAGTGVRSEYFDQDLGGNR
jgi:hypothetical protein